MAASAQLSPELMRALAHPGGNLSAEIAAAVSGMAFVGKALAGRDGAKPYVLANQEIKKQEVFNDELAIERARIAAELLKKDDTIHTQLEEANRASQKGVLEVLAEGGKSPFVTARSALKLETPQEEGVEPRPQVIEEARGVDDGKLVRKAVLKTDLGAVASLDESHEQRPALPTPGRVPSREAILSV